MTQNSSTQAKPTPKNLNSTEPEMRVNAKVTPAEHLKLKVYAAKNQTTISEIVRELIKNLPD